MKRIFKTAAVMAIAASAINASAQVSNTVYFDKYNYRQHQLNPAFIPDQQAYLSVIGNVAMDFGNSCISFSDVVKNVTVNGKSKSVLFLDKNYKNGEGYKEFLDVLDDDLRIFSNMYVDIFHFGFRAGAKNYISISSGVKFGTNFSVPKSFFQLALDGMEKDKKFNLDAGSIYADAYAYAELAVTFSRKVGDRLSLGLTGKYLKGLVCAKTDFSQITATCDKDEWQFTGEAEVMGAYPGLKVFKDKDNKLDFDYKDEDLKASDFKGNAGFGIDLGASFKLTEKLTLSASLVDLGFINYKENVGSAKMVPSKPFHFKGGTYTFENADDDDNQNDDNSADKEGKIDFDEFEDSFKDAFDVGNTTSFKQRLNTKIYAGASWEPIRFLGLGFLSKTTFASSKVSQEFSASANLRLFRILSLNGMYSMMDGTWHAVGIGVNLNLGPINIFTACDNIPLHYGKNIGKDEFIFPDKLTSTRYNFGLGLVFGSKEHKDKKKAKKEEKESIIDDTWRNNAPEPDFFDKDGDGVADDSDHCPDTQAGVAVDEEGCPLDTDYDGVPDYLDKCPDTPAGAKVDENGCALDSDGDGVNDTNDRCPDTPKGASVDEHGCPIDTDRDGVPDYKDKCADTPSSASVDASGCPLDTDGDGIPDYLDHCPDVAGITANNGCPEVKEEAKQIFRKALNGIQFETGKSTIIKSSYPILDDIANIMRENPEYKLFIKGHTDNDGDALTNLKLSKERAAEVLDYLKGKGIKESRMHSEGYGDTQPVVPNNSAANKAKNRRVEFEVEF